MKFGFLYSGHSYQGIPRDQVLKDILAVAQVAGECRYDSVWWPASYLNRGWNNAAILSRIAAEAPGVGLGTVVVLPLHSPIEIAEQASTLDVVCGGRLTLAVAQGWRDALFAAFGVPRRERLGRALESLEAMKTLWTQDPATYHGRHYSFDNLPGAAPSRRKPYPRLVAAATGDPAVRRAARIAEGWLVSSRAAFPVVERQAELYRQACREAGTEPHIVAWRECFVGPTREEALRQAAPYIAGMFAERFRRANNTDVPGASQFTIRTIQELLADLAIIGSPQDCVDGVERYRAIGVSEIILRMQWPRLPVALTVESLQRFAAEVRPLAAEPLHIP